MSSNPLFAIVWILLLLFVVWPVAGFLAGIWILLQPFETVAPFVKQITDFLEKLITWPREVGKAILTCQTTFPAPAM